MKKLSLLAIIQLIFLSVFGQTNNTYYGTNTVNMGSRNAFFGVNAGYQSTASANDNTFLGFVSGSTTTSGGQNVFIGSYAGQFNTTGSNNVFIGYSSGSYTTSGVGNIGLGSSSNGATTTGSYNTYLGHYSGRSNNTGYNNVGLGYFSGFHFTSGYKNVALGDNAGYSATTGNSNVFVGSASGYSNVTGIGNVFIGANAGYNELGSNKLYIDNTNTATPLIYGDFSSRTVAINATTFTVNGVAITGGTSSQWTTSGTNINYNAAGVVSIGTATAPTGYKLAVGGKMVAEEVVIKLQANWPDYVFNPAYKLPSLVDVEKFIQTNHHLQGVPSETEVKKDGLAVGDMNAVLLKKIEELTLYIIDLEKRLKEVEKR